MIWLTGAFDCGSLRADSLVRIRGKFIRDFKIQRHGRQRERQKTKGLISKATTLHVHHAFLYISFLFLHEFDVKMPNLAEKEDVTEQATTKLYFSF